MKTLASIIFGIAVGWAIIHANSIIPGHFQEAIANTVARSETIKNISEAIYSGDITSRPLHWWVMAFSTSAPILIIIALTSNLFTRITGNSSAFIYSSLIYPAIIILMAFYKAQKAYDLMPPYGEHLLNFAKKQASFYILDISSFMLFFFLIYALLNMHKLRRA